MSRLNDFHLETSPILLKINIPLPWHLEVYILMKVQVSWSRVIYCHFEFVWIINKKWRIHWVVGKWQVENHTNLILICYFVYLDFVCTSLDFCSTYLYDKVKTNLWNDWFSYEVVFYVFKIPSLLVISSTILHSNHRPKFASILGIDMHHKHSSWK